MPATVSAALFSSAVCMLCAAALTGAGHTWGAAELSTVLGSQASVTLCLSTCPCCLQSAYCLVSHRLPCTVLQHCNDHVELALWQGKAAWRQVLLRLLGCCTSAEFFPGQAALRSQSRPIFPSFHCSSHPAKRALRNVRKEAYSMAGAKQACTKYT